jgi:hypothetical protein
MPIINPLPFTLTNGTLANADEVMADFNAIVANVNSNALPSGSALTGALEWTLLLGAPTYVSATSFTMPGDQTATFSIGRRVKSANTAGTTYSVVVSSAVSLNTTVTVTNTSGVLDSGLSAVSVGTLDATNQSTPAITDFTAPTITVIPPASPVLLFIGAAVTGDVLSEWIPASGIFQPKVAGTYVFTLSGYMTALGANVTNGDQFVLQLNKTPGGLQNISWVNWPLPSGVQPNVALPLSGFFSLALVVGDFVQFNLLTPAYSAAPMSYVAQLSIRRLPY